MSMSIGGGATLVNNISNSNYQNQSQCVNAVDNALRKFLTVEQYTELAEMIKELSNKDNIMNRIKDLGHDVLAGVLSTIISSTIM